MPAESSCRIACPLSKVSHRPTSMVRLKRNAVKELDTHPYFPMIRDICKQSQLTSISPLRPCPQLQWLVRAPSHLVAPSRKTFSPSPGRDHSLSILSNLAITTGTKDLRRSHRDCESAAKLRFNCWFDVGKRVSMSNVGTVLPTPVTLARNRPKMFLLSQAAYRRRLDTPASFQLLIRHQKKSTWQTSSTTSPSGLSQ